MADLTLYKVDASPPANAVRVLAEILGLKMNLVDVDFFAKEHKSQKILALNPLGTVPILKDGEFVLTDSHAQMKYLLAKYGKAEHSALYPKDIEAQALVDQSLFLDAAIIFIRFKVVILPAVMEGLKAPTERHLRDLAEGYGMLEAYLKDRKYVAANHFTIADISLGTSIAAAGTILKVDKERFPRTTAWLERLHSIPEFHKYVSAGVTVLLQILDTLWAKDSQ